MSPQLVRMQLRSVYERMIRTGLSVKQNFPRDQAMPGGAVRIGDLPVAGLALKNVAYGELYDELDNNDAYHIKLPDGGLLIFQYTFDAKHELSKHRLAFFPSDVLPTIEEAPYLYENDELYADVLLNRLVRFPIRIDFDPQNHKDVLHPKAHLTLGQFEACRIPVVAPVTPNAFVVFLLRNFYWRSYRHNMNTFAKNMKSAKSIETITTAERRISHFVMM